MNTHPLVCAGKMFAKQICKCKNANLWEKPYNINKVDKVEKAQLITGNQINSMKMLRMLIHYQKVEKCFSFIVWTNVACMCLENHKHTHNKGEAKDLKSRAHITLYPAFPNSLTNW